MALVKAATVALVAALIFYVLTVVTRAIIYKLLDRLNS